MMNTIMIVFSATHISEKIARFAIEGAENEKARLILLDVRDQDISRKVGQMAGDIGFTDIPRLIEMTLQKAEIMDDVSSLERILQADTIARTITRECIQDMQ